jgi:hypothetical protein
MRGMFPLVRDAVAKVIDPARLRWIGMNKASSLLAQANRCAQEDLTGRTRIR